MREELPIFLINGFLDSGKTTLIKNIISENPNYHNHSTVIIACEEGEEEYDKAWCQKYGVHVEYIEDEDELTPEFMEDLEDVYRPNQIVIEYNSFFDFENQDFPEHMVIYQQITLIDASSFQVMFNNMKKIFNTMVQYSGLIIFNRSLNNPNLPQFRRQIRMFNPQGQVAFEALDGSLYTTLEEDLPYDLSKDEILIGEDDYPIWYMEVFDRKEKYFKPTFRFKTFVRDVTDNTFVIGRNVMSCCEDDIQFLGYEVINESDYKPNIGDCIFITCKVVIDYSYIANDDVVMLKATKVSKLPNEKETVINF
jgi:hypothetical protein